MPPYQSRIGAMRETLTLQANTLATSTGDGFKTDSWATYASVPAEYVQPAGGRESWQGAAVVAELPPVFRIRYRVDVQPKHRLLWRGRTLQIHAVIPQMTVGNRFLLLQTGLAQ